MDDSIPERCGEDLPLNRVSDDEADAPARRIRPVADILVEGYEIPGKMRLEFHLGGGVSLVRARRVVRSEKIREQGVCRLRL